MIAVGVLVIGLAGVLWLFKWDWLHEPAERMLSKQIGRNLQIGRLSGEKTLRPRIVIEDIHLDNAEWGREPEMLSAERIEFVVSLPELLRRRLVLPEIHLIKPKVSLERRKDGASNWTFGAKEAADVAAPEARQETPLIGLLVVDEGVLVYRDEKAELDINSKISTAVGDASEGREELRLTGNGNLRGESFTLNVRGGSLLALREGDEPYPLTVELKAGPTLARISGTLQDPVKFEGLNLDARLTGPNLGRLTRATGVPLPMTPAYDLRGRLQRNGTVWAVENLDGKVGESDLNGDFRIDTGKERLQIDADLRSKVLDYRDVGPLIGIQTDETDQRAQEQQGTPNAKPEGRTAAQEKKEDQQKENQQARSGQQAPRNAQQAPPPRVLPDTPLAAQQIRETDARVKFRGERVEAPGVPLSAVDLDLNLQDSVLQLRPLRVGVAGGVVDATIRLDVRRDPVRTDYDVKLSRFDLGRVLANAGLKDSGGGVINGRIRMNGTGDTIRKSLGSANGDARFSMSGGTLSNLALELVGLDVAEAATFWAGGDKTVPLRCFVADLGIQNGVITPRVFVLDTTDTTITAEGNVSLKDEQLGLKLVAHPKDPSLFTARTPITINGAFSQPAIGVQAVPLGARVAGAIALGALLTPVAAILAFIEPGLEQDSDCVALLRDHEQKR